MDKMVEEVNKTLHIMMKDHTDSIWRDAGSTTDGIAKACDDLKYLSILNSKVQAWIKQGHRDMVRSNFNDNYL